MKLFGRACLAVSLALVPIACGDDENGGGGTTPTPDASTCGNGTVDTGEECDGEDVACADAMMAAGMVGTATCSNCQLDVSSCSSGTGGSGTGGAPPATGGAGGMGPGGMMGAPDGGGSGGTGGTDAGGTGGTPEAGTTPDASPATPDASPVDASAG